MNAIVDDTRGSLGKERVERLKEWDFTKTSVRHDGSAIVLPADPQEMDLRSAAKHLNKLADEEDTKIQALEIIECFPFDGLVAITSAMEHLFGWASPVPQQGFFGPVPPKLISIQTGHDTFRQVPVGDFTVPAIPEQYKISVGMTKHESKWCAYISSVLPRKYERIIRMIGKTAREFLRTQSIYKGKSIRLIVSDGEIDYNKQPTFFPTGHVTESDLHLNHDIMQMVETSILTPIRHKDKCLAARVPLKRGVLLEGAYGTGKSLISTVTSKIANQHGWTFMLIDDVSALESALQLAKRYEPCVVFAEDLDRVIDLDRDDKANAILNTIDGVLSKNSEVMVVFTTNHVERINKAMLRPGRLDAVISILPPNADTCERLLTYYGRGMIAANEDLGKVCEVLAGQIPATIREVVERSKLHTIPRMISGDDLPQITADDLLVTATQMTRHLELLNGPVNAETDAEAFYRTFGKLVTNAAADGPKQAMESVVEGIDENMSEYADYVIRRVNQHHDENSLGMEGAKDACKMALRETRAA